VSRFHRFVGYLLLGAAFLVAVIGGGDLFWLAVYLLFAGVVLTAPKPDTRTMTATIAGHTLAAGDVVVDKHGRRYRLAERWLDVGWSASGTWGDIFIADEALAATGPDRSWWWDS
jgi:hypothetical protein